jgi:hypothetical protein
MNNKISCPHSATSVASCKNSFLNLFFISVDLKTGILQEQAEEAEKRSINTNDKIFLPALLSLLSPVKILFKGLALTQRKNKV